MLATPRWGEKSPIPKDKSALTRFLHHEDTLDAWGCVGTVVTQEQEEDTYPTRMYVFLLDAPPIHGTGSCASEAEATARAEGWIQWHLNQVSCYNILMDTSVCFN